MYIVLTLKRNQYALNSKVIGISSFTPSISPPCHNLKKMANKIKTLAWKIIIIIIIILITTKTIIIIITTTTTTAAAEGVVVQGYK